MKGKFDRPSRPGAAVNVPEAEHIAMAALDFLAADTERVAGFLDAAGLDLGALRRAAQEPHFLSAVLDHVVGDERLLIACADALGLPPERVAAAWRRLSPQDFD